MRNFDDEDDPESTAVECGRSYKRQERANYVKSHRGYWKDDLNEEEAP